MKLLEKEIKELKSKHKVDGIIEIPYNDKVAYLKEPGRNDVEYILTEAQSGPLSMVEALLETCWLQGDEELKSDVKFKTSLMGETDKILGITTLKIKNY